MSRQNGTYSIVYVEVKSVRISIRVSLPWTSKIRDFLLGISLLVVGLTLIIYRTSSIPDATKIDLLLKMLCWLLSNK